MKEESAEKRACMGLHLVFLALPCCGAAGITRCEMCLLSSILALNIFRSEYAALISA